jgi:hypothetical protein
MHLEFLFDCTVRDAVRLENEPWTVVQVAVTRLLWEVWSVTSVRIRQQQVQSNEDKGEDQDWSTVYHLQRLDIIFRLATYGGKFY